VPFQIIYDQPRRLAFIEFIRPTLLQARERRREIRLTKDVA